ncbi:MAG: recombinase A [Kofleriaceae bacterium]|nr:recombinase A [Kofleriaceae bacterium]
MPERSPSGSAAASLEAFLERARHSRQVDGARIISLGEVAAERAAPAARWQLDEAVGRLTELSGLGATASLSATTVLVLEAQARGEPSAWIGLPSASFFPPDLDDAGVDLDALVVVRAPDDTALVRAADRLLRSAAFGLIVLDLVARATGPGVPAGGVAVRGAVRGAGVRGAGAGAIAPGPVEIPAAVQGRLVGLAQRHDAAIVVLTEKPADAASLGSMVSLRLEAVRERPAGGGWRLAMRALKDKRRGPGWSEAAEVIGPAGLI